MLDPISLLDAGAERPSIPLVASLLLFSVGCSDSTGPVLLPTELCAGQSDAAVATFADPNLEAAVKNALSLGAQDPLTCRLASTLTSLEANFAGIGLLTGIHNLASATEFYLAGNFITDLSPLNGFAGLTILDVGENTITDISVVSGLTNLGALGLNKNSIEDIDALSGLTGLVILALDSNAISDISALSALTSLERLVLYNNVITDITVLSGLTNLTLLDLGENPIGDISVLSGFAFLTTLGLDNSSITDISALGSLDDISTIFLNGNAGLTDIQPLLDNTEFGPGDIVHLSGTNVSCTDIDVLAAKKVTVVSDC